MANAITSMETLMKGGSIRIDPGMVAIFPQFKQEETINVSELVPKFNGCYAVNNSTVCYVTENAEVFAAPYTRSAMEVLRNAGFTRSEFYVPFSNGDYPKGKRFQWAWLRVEAKELRRDEFVSDCKAFCDEHHIGSISEESLANCFQMPEEGVRVKHIYWESQYYPIITSTCMDCTVVDHLGRFSTNNGRVVFLYRDGKTYVTKGYWILSELRAAGYREGSLFVPFSNGEEILDPEPKAMWDRVSKK